jgi:hypothetical protein
LRAYISPLFGMTPLDKIDEPAISKLKSRLAERELHRKTTNNILSVLNTLLKVERE